MRVYQGELVEILQKHPGLTILQLDRGMVGRRRVRTIVSIAVRSGFVRVKFERGRRRYYPAEAVERQASPAPLDAARPGESPVVLDG